MIHSLNIFDVEDIWVFNDDVVHVNGVELGEIFWKRYQVIGGMLVELEEVRATTVIPLPT